MNVTLLRHAETEGNLKKQYIGFTDQPISPNGIERARLIGPDNAIARVYTSTLKRTTQTAEILFPHAEIIPVDGLKEMNFGRFEGKSWLDMEFDEEYREWVGTNCESTCPGGENKPAFTTRCKEAFFAVMWDELENASPDATFVVHGGVIMALLSELARPIRPYFNWSADFCGGYRLEYDDTHGEQPLQLIQEIRPRKHEVK